MTHVAEPAAHQPWATQFAHRPALLAIALFAAIALSRLPFLDAGYGTNHDAWRVAHAARVIAATGHYEVSRFPGYPVHEIVCALFRSGGPVALNGLSAFFSVAAAAALWLIVRELNCRDPVLLVAAFAATPTVFINSVSSKDYVWGLAFVLWAIYAAMKRAPVVSGVLFGLAIGCRITSGAMLLPLVLIIYGAHRDWRATARFCTIAAFIAVIAFLPVFARYGWEFFTFYNSHNRPNADTILTRGTIELFGTLGVIGLIAAAVSTIPAHTQRWARSIPAAAPPERLSITVLGAWCVLYVIAFIALPDQAGYLIPLVPPALLLLARLAARRAFQIACVCLLIAPWIELAAGKLVAGPVLADHAARLNTLRDVQQFVRVIDERVPPNTIVVVGAWQPIIEELFPDAPTRSRYVYLLSRSDIEAAAQNGAPLAYATEMIRGFNYRVHGIDLAAYGAINLQKLLTNAP